MFLRYAIMQSATSENRFAGYVRSVVRVYVRLIPYRRGKERLIRIVHRLIGGPRSRQLVKIQNGLVMEVDANEFIQRAIYYHGTYERENLSILKRFLKPGMVLVDCGANVGLFTLVGAGLVTESGEVHAFEPTPQTFSALEKNVAINSLPQVYLNQTALANQPEDGRSFYISQNDNAGSNSLAATGAAFTAAEFSVRVSTLDAYFADRRRLPDFIKLDVEGAELLVLSGAVHLLKKAHPLLLLEAAEENMKPFRYDSAELIGFLRSTGYAVSRVTLSGDIVPLRDDMEPFETLFCAPANS